jgi:hypothetical protein
MWGLNHANPQFFFSLHLNAKPPNRTCRAVAFASSRAMVKVERKCDLTFDAARGRHDPQTGAKPFGSIVPESRG